jgi:hypothetical protein
VTPTEANTQLLDCAAYAAYAAYTASGAFWLYSAPADVSNNPRTHELRAGLARQGKTMDPAQNPDSTQPRIEAQEAQRQLEGEVLLYVFLLDLNLPHARTWVADNLGAGLLTWARQRSARFLGVAIGPRAIVQELLTTDGDAMAWHRTAHLTPICASNRIQTTLVVDEELAALLRADLSIARGQKTLFDCPVGLVS